MELVRDEKGASSEEGGDEQLSFAAFVGNLYGVANERKWGYWTLGGTAIVTVLSDFWWMWRFREVMELGLLVDLMFDAALLILVFHPMSREYRKVWFS